MILRTLRALIIVSVMALLSVSASANEQAGIVEKMRGTASTLSGGNTIALSEGAAIHVGDVVMTSDNARLRILFQDKSTLVMGEKAQMVIDELIYVPAGREPEHGEQSLKFVKGVFQFVSGKIAHSDTRQVALNTPVATIGIRGTRLLTGELQVGMPPGNPHYGFQILEGAIDIIAPLGTVTLKNPGEGTFLPLDRVIAPRPPRQWTKEEAAEAAAAVAF